MREFALLLVLANLGVLCWALWIQPEIAAPSTPALPAELPGLVLTDSLLPAAAPATPDSGDAQAIAEEPVAEADAAAVDGGGLTAPADEPELPQAAGADGGQARGTADSAMAGESADEPEFPDVAGGDGEQAPGAGDAAMAESSTDGPELARGDEAQALPGDAAIALAEAISDVERPLPGAASGEPGEGDAEEVADTDTDLPTPEAPAPADAEPFCVSLGPFLDLPETADAAAGLRGAGYSPRQHLLESEVWIGHWVLLPPEESREQAIAVVEALRALGVTDLYIEPGGELRNSISLGLFSDRVRAETRAGGIRQLGYAPEIRDRTRTASVYWIDVFVREEDEIDPNDYGSKPGRNIRVENDLCSTEP